MSPLATLVQPLDHGRVRCLACQWYCALGPGDVGRCKMRVGSQDGIELLNHGMISGATIGPIEDHRLWHFFPDTTALAIGGWGYSLPVDQQRGQYSALPADPAKQRRLDPQRAADVALERLCRGVVWAFGDPAVNFEYLLALLQLSRAASRYTAIVTSGMLSSEALSELGPYLNGISLELRGFSDQAYARLGGISEWRSILQFAEEAQHRWQCHLEITTRIHHGVNDHPDELRELVSWIKTTLGAETPWHVLPGDAGSETAAATMRARRIGHEGGLQFIYGAEPSQATRCPACQSTLINRQHGVSRRVDLDGNRCLNCGYTTNLYLSIHKVMRSVRPSPRNDQSSPNQE